MEQLYNILQHNGLYSQEDDFATFQTDLKQVQQRAKTYHHRPFYVKSRLDVTDEYAMQILSVLKDEENLGLACEKLLKIYLKQEVPRNPITAENTSVSVTPTTTAPSDFQTEMRTRSQEPLAPKYPTSNKSDFEISFVCSTTECHETMSQLMAELGERRVLATWKILQDQVQKFEKKYLSELFGILTVGENVKRDERKMFETPMTFKVLPSTMRVEYSTPVTLKNVMEMKLTDVRVVLDRFGTKFMSLRERSEVFVFCNYFRIVLGARLQYLPKEVIDVGLRNVGKIMIGMGHHLKKMKPEVRMLTSTSIPRGFIFWGPPGTGKTTVVKNLCDEWMVHLVCVPLASGDFKKGIVGDSEKMIRILGERAALIPWVMCAVAIDEIDALATSRAGSGVEKGSADLLSVLLSMIGGLNDVPNLIFFGSTNLLHTMDEAFLRRMDGKFFVGKPSFKAREEWIEKFINDKKIILDPSRKNITITMMKMMTLNFSHDAMGKLLKKLAENSKYDYQDKPLTIKEIEPFIVHICKMNKIYFGRYTLPSLVNDLELMNANTRFLTFYDLWKIAKNGLISNEPCTGRIFIDRLADYNNTFQVEYFDMKLQSNKPALIEYLLDPEVSIKDIDIMHKNRLISQDLTDILREILGSILSGASKISNYSSLLLSNSPVTIIANYFQTKFSVPVPNNISSFFAKQTYHVSGKSATLLEELEKYLIKYAREYILHMKSGFYSRFQESNSSRNLQLFDVRKSSPYDEAITIEEVIKLLLKFGVEGNLDAVYMIDGNTLYANQKNTEEDIIIYIESIVEECEQYNKSLIIFDLDSIAEVTREYSGLREEIKSSVTSLRMDTLTSSGSGLGSPTFSYRMLRPQVITRVLRLLSSVQMVQKGPKTWYASISSDNFLSQFYKEKLLWPETDEDRMKKIELLENRRIRKCVVCDEEYTELENNSNACGRHAQEFLYLESEKREKEEKLKKTMENQGINAIIDSKKVLSELNRYSKADIVSLVSKFQIIGSDAKYFCCGRSVWEKGEVPCHHTSD